MPADAETNDAPSQSEETNNEVGSMRTYRGFISDSERWQRFHFRNDDIIITTPSKCGTTWMQSIVGTLVFGSPSTKTNSISIWFDCLLRSEAEATAIVESQNHHRRFLKTHVPLDGLPRVDGATYITVVRHPLDVAMSDFDHCANQRRDRTIDLVRRSSSEMDETPKNKHETPTERGEFLKWWIDNDIPPDGAGPHGLQDYCQQVRTYWEARHDANVHLFHYSDLWNNLKGGIRRVADILDIKVDEDKLPTWVDALTLESMKSRANETAPEAHLGLWKSNEDFFASGGPRDWKSFLTNEDMQHFEARLDSLAGDAKTWMLNGGEAQ